ncbi:MAG: NADH-ubiquinone oxidoreductase [Gammaproteobacteria bacterium]|nr:NADH-ubiquinone oxidoreductase [Gammaproteobacteria bacterium]
MVENDGLRDAALAYHCQDRAGKLAIRATKPLSGPNELSLAYSPGVAYPSLAIAANPAAAATYTARNNLVAVITNGTAVLGLGDIGPLAAKPVMEGKAVLFKTFADIDVFDIEIDERDPQLFIDTVVRLQPTFAGINLEDIAAPECFTIEEGLRQRLSIPVFHDDQHGTAVVVAATVINALYYTGKQLDSVKLVVSGAGAAALACCQQLLAMGLPQGNITVCDAAGVIYRGRRERMNHYKAAFAADTDARTLAEALQGADIFLGLSVAGALQPQWLAAMRDKPLIMALANPQPEILPALVQAVRPDALVATGRSDFANQVNNVLCFPFLFRGLLDAGVSTVERSLLTAAAHAIAGLARRSPLPEVEALYGNVSLAFNGDNLIPKPFDPRLLEEVAAAVAETAMAQGIAARPLQDVTSYRQTLRQLGWALFTQRQQG